MITKNVRLYLGDGFPERIPVSQYDTMWQFVFTIINNSRPWQIPTGATAVLNGRKPDGNVFAFSGTIENNTVTVDADVQMTAVAGQTVCELSILADGKVVGTANFVLDVEAAPKSPDDVVSDTVLDGYGMMVTNAVDSWLNSHSGQIGGLTNEAKQALLTLLAHVAYIDNQGQTYLDALEDALYPPANLVSIAALFDQGENVVYDTDSLDTLKQYLTVTANMSDGTTQTVNNYTLSGTLTAGTSTITVSYGGKTTTFNVTVTDPSVIQITYTQGSIGGGNTDADRVSGVIESSLHFGDGETYILTVPDGYSVIPFGFVPNSDQTAAGTKGGSAGNILNTYVVSDSSYVVPRIEDMGGTLYGNTKLLNNKGNAGWMTGTITYTFTKTGQNSYTFTGLGFGVKKNDGANITPSDIEPLITINKVEASS